MIIEVTEKALMGIGIVGLILGMLIFLAVIYILERFRSGDP